MARAGGAARSLNQLRPLRGVHRPGEKVVIIIICTRASFIAIRDATLARRLPRSRACSLASDFLPREKSGARVYRVNLEAAVAVSPFFPAASNESERDRARPRIVGGVARGRGVGASPSRAWVCV